MWIMHSLLIKQFKAIYFWVAGDWVWALKVRKREKPQPFRNVNLSEVWNKGQNSKVGILKIWNCTVYMETGTNLSTIPSVMGVVHTCVGVRFFFLFFFYSSATEVEGIFCHYRSEITTCPSRFSIWPCKLCDENKIILKKRRNTERATPLSLIACLPN